MNILENFKIKGKENLTNEIIDTFYNIAPSFDKIYFFSDGSWSFYLTDINFVADNLLFSLSIKQHFNEFNVNEVLIDIEKNCRDYVIIFIKNLLIQRANLNFFSQG